MIRPLNILFVLADAGHGRLVRLSRETGDYVTLIEHRNEKPPRKGEPVAVFERFGAGRHTSEQGGGAAARAEADFIRGLVAQGAELFRKGGFAGVALVALPRTLAQIRDFLPSSVPVMGELAKDLTKVRDHDLAAWLREVRPPAES